MQLDQTNVAIRVRTLSEIGDLSLLMIRRYPRAFFQAFFLGAAFWILLDTILLGWIPFRFSGADEFDEQARIDFFRYLFWMATLVFLQTPIAGVLSTFSLGQSIFERQPTLSQTVREVGSMFRQICWTLGVKRMAIPAVVMLAFRWGEDWNGFFDVFMPVAFILIASLIRSNRPFVGEMILLERCPLSSTQPGVITLKRRSKALHSPMSSELGGRFLTVGMVLAALLGCVFYSIFWARGIAIGVWQMDLVACLVFYPLALWLIASLSVVVRLLGYLDARIRLEGWEVELAIRAEAIRQFGEDIMTAPESPQPSSLSPEETPSPEGTTSTKSTMPTEPAPKTSVTSSPTTTTTVALLAAISLLAMSGRSFADADDAGLQGDPNRRSFVSNDIMTHSHFGQMTYINIVGDSVWFDADSGKIVPIELRDKRADSGNRESRWIPQPKNQKTKQATQTPTNTTPTTGGGTSWGSLSWGNLFGWLLLAILMAVLVGMLAYVFANSSFDFRPEPTQQTLVTGRGLDEQTKQRIAELPAELRDTDVNPRSELERLMQRGDFDRAIIFLFGHQLLLLDRAAWLRLSRWKTNRQYVCDARSSRPEAGELLAKTVESFERSYFGRHSLNREQFDVLWQDNLRLEAMLTSPAEGKA